MSEDPIGFSAGDPNLSRFVGNQALSHIDPDGLEEVMNKGTGSGKQEEVVSIVGAIGKAAATYKQQEEVDGYDALVFYFGDFEDVPNNPSGEFAGRVACFLYENTDPKNDTVTVKEVPVEWDKFEEEIEKLIDEFVKSGRRIDAVIVVGAEPESEWYRFEKVGKSERVKAPDEKGQIPGQGSVAERNGAGKSPNRRELPGIEEFQKAVNSAIKKSGEEPDRKVGGSSDAGKFMCNSAVYKIDEVVDDGRVIFGVFIHIPPDTKPREPGPTAVAKGIVDALFDR